MEANPAGAETLSQACLLRSDPEHAWRVPSLSRPRPGRNREIFVENVLLHREDSVFLKQK